MFSLFFMGVLVLSANAQLTIDPASLNLAMTSGSYAIQKISVFNQSSLNTEIAVSCNEWMEIYPNQFKLEAGKRKDIVCTFLINQKEKAERAGEITFNFSKQEVILPVSIMDPVSLQKEQQAQLQKQADDSKDVEIKHLKEQLAKKDKELVEKTKQISELQDTVRELTKTQNEAIAKKEAIEQKLIAKEAEIVETNELRELKETLAFVGKNEKAIEPEVVVVKSQKEKPGLSVAAKVLKEKIGDEKTEVALKEKEIHINIFYAFSSGKVNPKEGIDEKIADVAKIIKEQVPLAKIKIKAHTDSVAIGPKLVKKYPTNCSLSQARAEFVKEVISQQGYEIKEYSFEGVGDAYPIADNKIVNGRAKNRRIEIIITPG